MILLISKILLKIIGWKVQTDHIENFPQKCVVIAAPHTSNWDAPIMVAVFRVLGIPFRWALKDEFMRFPLKQIFGPLGAIGINRRAKKEGEERQSTTEALAELFKHNEKLALCIAPEGTRSLRTKWKTGFYYVALNANVPIAFGFLDYGRKLAGIGDIIYPSGDLEADMKKITAFYKTITPKIPELYALDEQYV